jgi:hypothetical protein
MMTINTHHEDAILHQNAATAHLIAAKQCEKNARAADLGALPASLLIPDTSSAWYHAEAPRRRPSRRRPRPSAGPSLHFLGIP